MRPTLCDACGERFERSRMMQAEVRAELFRYGPVAAQELADEIRAPLHEKHDETKEDTT